MNNLIQTVSGHQFDPANPSINDINITDIAHGLANTCRCNGQSKRHYSVAQHSVIVSEQLPRDLQLQALLHDASEAYLCDLPTPLKVRPEFQAYREMEQRLQAIIYKAFNLPEETDPIVKRMDRRVMVTESIQLMTHPIQSEELPIDINLVPWSINFAREQFLLKAVTLLRVQ